MTCRTQNGDGIDVSEAASRALFDHIRRVVHNSAGVVTDLGRKSRVFRGNGRDAALLLTDRCIWPGCDRKVRQCQVDHNVEWQHHGCTDGDNARCLCGRHNRLKTVGRFSVHRLSDGDWRILGPDGELVGGETRRGHGPCDMLGFVVETLLPQRRGRVTLRPIAASDLGWLAAMACDSVLVGEHNWAGIDRSRVAVEAELRDEHDRNGLLGHDSGSLIVEIDGDVRIGDVSWRTERWGPSSGSTCPSFGIAIVPEFRGHGFGTLAQRLLVDYLFLRDPETHRVQSDTALDNVAERRALGKVGMVEEGIIREAEHRGGRHHDHVVVSMLRHEWAAA